jgi:hypothetical protein
VCLIRNAADVHALKHSSFAEELRAPSEGMQDKGKSCHLGVDSLLLLTIKGYTTVTEFATM